MIDTYVLQQMTDLAESLFNVASPSPKIVCLLMSSLHVGQEIRLFYIIIACVAVFCRHHHRDRLDWGGGAYPTGRREIRRGSDASK